MAGMKVVVTKTDDKGNIDVVDLEEKVKTQEPLPLRHYVQRIASGATPKTTEYEKYYSGKENGIPFLRVQNLSPTGVLDTENVKYINKITHEKAKQPHD